MKTAAYIALVALTFGAFSPSYSYADDHEDTEDVKEEKVLSSDEAKALVMSTPEADDAVKGKVPDTKLKRYYDVRARQLAYREGVKEYRSSLEARRKSYAAPQIDAAENYRETIAKVYAAETKAAADARAESNEKEKDAAKEDMSSKKDEPVVEDDQVASVDDASETSEEEGVGLTEKPIPSDVDAEEGAPKKKVVTSDDAPDFDPSDL